MKISGYFLVLLVTIGCTIEKIPDAQEILNKSVVRHDPNNLWSQTVLKTHIQEPRVGNPLRYSVVELDNNNNTFKLERNRGEHISTHIIDIEGNKRTLFNGIETQDSILIEKYRLDPERNSGYRDFYQTMYGLPMSLNNGRIDKFLDISTVLFNNEECYELPLILKEAMFSEYWSLFISKSDYSLKGIEIKFPDDENKGERLYFDGQVIIDKIKIPRIRHWYELGNNSYSGSDIIMQEDK